MWSPDVELAVNNLEFKVLMAKLRSRNIDTGVYDRRTDIGVQIISLLKKAVADATSKEQAELDVSMAHSRLQKLIPGL